MTKNLNSTNKENEFKSLISELRFQLEDLDKRTNENQKELEQKYLNEMQINDEEIFSKVRDGSIILDSLLIKYLKIQAKPNIKIIVKSVFIQTIIFGLFQNFEVLY